MAKFPVSLATAGVFHAPNLTAAAADKVSALLRRNHDLFHVYWNHAGFHNHQVHYLLTAYALGASAAELQHAFDDNAHYQRPALPLTPGLFAQLSNDDRFRSLMGNDVYFRDYTAFFLERFDRDGWQNVVNRYLFSRTEIADDMLVRLHADLLHPLLHLGFGVEFQQPTVIAEALAQAACHHNRSGPALLAAERLAAARPLSASPGSPLIDLIRAVRSDRSRGRGSRPGQMWQPRLWELAADWTVGVNELEAKTAEMINVAAFVAGAAQRPPREVKLDFALIHEVNASLFQSAFLAQPWLSDQNKARLLAWKGRMDLLAYAAQAAPELHADEIAQYRPAHAGTSWASVVARTNALRHDDGHVAKLIRALAHGARVCAPYEAQPECAARFPLRGDAWLQVAHMALDSTTSPQLFDRWIRGAGSTHSWRRFDDRPRLRM